MCEIQQVQLASRKHRHKPQHLLLPYSSRDPLGTGECQQQAGTWHPVPAGHLPACAAQPGEPRASPPPCLVPARLQLWAAVPWSCFAAPSQQGRRTWANATQPAATTEQCQQTPLAFELLPVFILASCPREKAAHARVSWKCEFQCLHFSAWLPLGSHVPHAVLAPLHVWTRRRLENLRVQRGRDTRREPRLPVAEGRDKWCPHTVRRKHCFIA